MKARSAKNKGDRFEKYLVERLRAEIDKNTHQTKGSGAGLDKNDIRIPSLNIEIEAKNAATFNLQGDWEQAKAQNTTGNTTVLAIRHPKQPEFQETLVVMGLEDWLELIKNQAGEVKVTASWKPEYRWEIQRLIESAKKVIKVFEQ